MLNKTTSPRNEKGGRGHLGSIKSREFSCLVTKRNPWNGWNSLDFFTKWLWERVCHQRLETEENRTYGPSGLSEQQNKRGGTNGNKPGKRRPARSASRWAQERSPGPWWPGPCWPATRTKESGDALGHTPSERSLKHGGAHLGFFVAYHGRPPLAGRQIEIHGVPADGSFEPEGGESDIHIMAGCMEILSMGHKSLQTGNHWGRRH